MKNITIKHLILTLLCCLPFAQLSFGQALMYEIPLNEQIPNSSQIIEGKVLSKASYWNETRTNIYTINTIEVYKVFKGQETQQIEVVTLGGTVGLQSEIITPSLDLQINSEGLFLLTETSTAFSTAEVSSNSKYKPYSSAQGFYKYNISDDLAANPYSVISNITSNLYGQVKSLTGVEPIIVNEFDVDSIILTEVAQRDSNAITSISPSSITAGTGSILTIIGSAFGSTEGTVSFKDSNDGGSTYYQALSSQIVSWSSSLILVEVPSRAGTGNVRVTTSTGTTFTSSNTLTIPYAITNVSSDAITGILTAYQAPHINENGTGGYTWQMNSSFATNTLANQSFTRAFDSWRCETGVNWEIAATSTSTNATTLDGTNIIRFAPQNEMPNAGVLGYCSYYASGCGINGNTSLQWFVAELDITFNSSINWEYGPGAPSGSEYDFETVAVHELGHGHQLGHVINTNAIMHWSIGPGVSNRILSTNDENAGAYVQNLSTSINSCGQGSMTNYSCSLGLQEELLATTIGVYPNPNNGTFTLTKDASLNLERAIIRDIRGREISTIDLSNMATSQIIELNNTSKGMYLITIESAEASATKKIIIE